MLKGGVGYAGKNIGRVLMGIGGCHRCNGGKLCSDRGSVMNGIDECSGY